MSNLIDYMNMKKVLFLIDIPEKWVGCNLKIYPPVKQGTVMLIDKETAEALNGEVLRIVE